MGSFLHSTVWYHDWNPVQMVPLSSHVFLRGTAKVWFCSRSPGGHTCYFSARYEARIKSQKLSCARESVQRRAVNPVFDSLRWRLCSGASYSSVVPAEPPRRAERERNIAHVTAAACTRGGECVSPSHCLTFSAHMKPTHISRITPTHTHTHTHTNDSHREDWRKQPEPTR